MKTTITSKGQITIPKKIRERLHLEAGDVLEFDNSAPMLVARLAFDEKAMRGVLGCARNARGRPSPEWLDETRGAVRDAPEEP